MGSLDFHIDFDLDIGFFKKNNIRNHEYVGRTFFLLSNKKIFTAYLLINYSIVELFLNNFSIFSESSFSIKFLEMSPLYGDCHSDDLFSPCKKESTVNGKNVHVSF